MEKQSTELSAEMVNIKFDIQQILAKAKEQQNQHIKLIKI